MPPDAMPPHAMPPDAMPSDAIAADAIAPGVSTGDGTSRDAAPIGTAAVAAPADRDGGLAARVGVLVYEPPLDPGVILAPALRRLAELGVRVGGLMQRFGDRQPGRRASMWVEHLETGRTLRLDRQRGAGARACVLDAAALAEAATWLRQTVASAPAVIAVNRFGHAEAEGDGMRAEIAEAIVSGAVVLIAVRGNRLADLTRFLGETPVLLPPEAAAIADWAARAAQAAAAA